MQSRNIKDGSDSPTLIKVQDVASRLSVSVRSVWRLISISELETVRIGKCVRVTAESVEDFLERGGTRN